MESLGSSDITTDWTLWKKVSGEVVHTPKHARKQTIARGQRGAAVSASQRPCVNQVTETHFLPSWSCPPELTPLRDQVHTGKHGIHRDQNNKAGKGSRSSVTPALNTVADTQDTATYLNG